MHILTHELFRLAGIIRDFKKYTSKRLLELIKTVPESRSEWMLNKFSFEANRTKRGKDYLLWQEGYHGKQIETNNFLYEKLNYLPRRRAGIHENPVEGGFVSDAMDFVYSSARNYGGETGVMRVKILG